MQYIVKNDPRSEKPIQEMAENVIFKYIFDAGTCSKIEYGYNTIRGDIIKHVVDLINIPYFFWV